MSLASRLSDLTIALAAAVNARSGKVGASAFDVAVINGYQGTQAQWLLMQQGGMTAAQRGALAGADLWAGRMVTETDTGITWRYVSATTGWKRWDSDWIAYNPGTVNVGITAITAFYRYRSGRVLVKFYGQWASNGTGTIVIATPVLFDYSAGQANKANGIAWLIHGSARYAMVVDNNSQSTFKFAYSTSTSNWPDWTPTAPVTLGSGDYLFFEVEYDPV